MLHTVGCSVAWLVPLVAWIGHEILREWNVSFNFCGPSLAWNLGHTHYAVNVPCDRWSYLGYCIGNLLDPVVWAAHVGSGSWRREALAIQRHWCQSLYILALDLEDPHLRGGKYFFYVQAIFFFSPVPFMGRLLGIQVSFFQFHFQPVIGYFIWLLQVVYVNQTGQISEHSDVSREFCIKGGMRQGCVLSPRLFCSVVQWAVGAWRCDVSNKGWDVGEGRLPVLDLRHADDILLFAGSAEQLCYMLDKLMISLGKVGLKLNAAKTKVGTIQAQSPKRLTTRAGLEIEVLDRHRPINGLAVWLSTANAGRRQGDINHRLPSAARVFQVHKWILCDKMVSLASRPKKKFQKLCKFMQIHQAVVFVLKWSKTFCIDFFKCFQSVIWANRRLTWSVFQSYISSRRRLRNPSSATVCVRSFSNATSQPQWWQT